MTGDPVQHSVALQVVNSSDYNAAGILRSKGVPTIGLLIRSFVEEPEKVMLVAASLLRDQPNLTRRQEVADPAAIT